MTKAVMGLAVFFSCMIVVTFAAAKLAEVKLYHPGVTVHDKPTLCVECGQYMWSGPHVHSCLDCVDE